MNKGIADLTEMESEIVHYKKITHSGISASFFLVLLAMAGIVDLHAIWQKILQIKPVRFLLKLI